MKKTSGKKQHKAFSLIEISAVILIIGIIIAGITAASSLVAKSRIATAKTLTGSAPVNGIQDFALWLETSLDTSIAESESDDNSPITSWSDIRNSTSKVRVVAVGTGPVYSNTINSIHAVKFSGSTSNYLQISDASFLNNTDYTIMVLEKRLSSGSNNYFIGASGAGSNNSLALGYDSNSTIAHSQGSNVYTSPAIVSSYSDSKDKARIFTFTQSSTDGKKTYINGLLAAQNSNTARLSGLTSLDIGKGYNGEIGEILIFTRALKAEERRSVEDYVGKKWTVKMNRDSAPSGSCVGYTVTSNGCDLSSASCSINQTGLVNRTVSAASSPTAISCDANFAGSPTYTCINGTPSVSGSCSCATDYSDPVGDGVCRQKCTINGIAGITDGTKVDHTVTSGSIACNGGGGPITYTCNNGSFNPTGGVCNVVACTGGDTTTYTAPGETIHVFSATSSINCTTSVVAKVLVVAGGGGGGGGGSSAGGAGGGGGGVLYNAALTIPSGSTPINVGNGGNGGPGNNYTLAGVGQTGQDSIFLSMTAKGGGGAGAREDTATAGSIGGSGGGGGVSGTSKNGGAGTAGQGNAGGANWPGGPNYGGGGGGGAGAVGQRGASNKGGDGGAGIANTITPGATRYYGGGGGASYYQSGGTYGAGGQGGGGGVGVAGTDGLGGGGGGGVNAVSAGSKGGSGVVIIRYTN